MNRLLLPVLGATLALGACNTRDGLQTGSVSTGAPRYASLDATLDGSAARLERQATPVAVLPPWIGRPIRLREQDDADAFEQVISLGDAPKSEFRENLVMVTMPHSRAATDRLVDGGARVMGKPTEAGIRAELEAVFPGLPMQVVTRPASNTYGPYGLAIGRNAAGARCLYAWQWIETPPALEVGARGPLSLRIRLCRGDITLEAMAASVNQLRLVPRFEGRPVSSAVAARPAGERRHRIRHARIQLEPRAVNQPPVIASVPAMPGPDASGRRYLGTDAGNAASYHSGPAIAGAMRGVHADLGSPALAPSPNGLTADLPPEAYRGPASGQSGNRL